MPDNGFCQCFWKLSDISIFCNEIVDNVVKDFPHVQILIESYELHCLELKNSHSVGPNICRRTGHTFSQAFITEFNSCHCSEIFFGIIYVLVT